MGFNRGVKRKSKLRIQRKVLFLTIMWEKAIQNCFTFLLFDTVNTSPHDFWDTCQWEVIVTLIMVTLCEIKKENYMNIVTSYDAPFYVTSKYDSLPFNLLSP